VQGNGRTIIRLAMTPTRLRTAAHIAPLKGAFGEGGLLQSARDFTPAGRPRLKPKPALLPTAVSQRTDYGIATTRGAEDVNWCAHL
jgi:hypothetical protein